MACSIVEVKRTAIWSCPPMSASKGSLDGLQRTPNVVIAEWKCQYDCVNDAQRISDAAGFVCVAVFFPQTTNTHKKETV
jgi:hypothetical protein